ncbi:MAG: hemolysin family protein [Planctomycetaceae bacterium]
MSGLLETALIVTVAAGALLMALACFSLRDFSRSRLEEICKEHDRLDRFGHILRNSERALLLMELVLMLVVIASSWTAARSSAFAGFEFPYSAGWLAVAEWLIRVVGILLIVSLLYIALPWTVSRVRGESLLFHIWPPISLLCRMTGPVWVMATRLDRLIHRVFDVPEPDSAPASMLADELLSVVDESQREGILQFQASTMIHRVMDLYDEDIAAIMTPRTDIVAVNASTKIRDAVPIIVEHGYSRVPVIRDNVDDVVGILYARDLLAFAISDNADASERTVETIVRDAFYAPESQGIDDLLEAMRQKKVHMAIVVDEYSGVSGLVTLEDILEEIVGEISDEYDEEEQPLVKRHKDGHTEVDARCPIDDLNEEFDLNLPEDEEFDTVGGFLLSCFGRIPESGETHQWQNLKLTVLEADERRILRIRIDAEVQQPGQEVEQL